MFVTDSLKSRLRWEYWANAIGSTNINLPQSFNELIFEVERGESIVRFPILVPYASLSETELMYRSGQYTSSNNYESVSIYATNTYVRLAYVHDSGDDVTSSSELRVYYR